MIKKQFIKTRQTTKVTFELDKDVDVDAAFLIADFTGWEPIAFDQLKSGKWKLVQELEPGQRHEFRYKLVQNGSEAYLNDPEADAYVGNDRGTENAVLHA